VLHSECGRDTGGLIWFVLFIWFIWLVSFNQKPDRPDEPNEQDKLTGFFSSLMGE
jgi:hypothetical protein